MTPKLQFDVPLDGSDLAASMLIDELGNGTVIICDEFGSIVSLDANRLNEIHRLLAECARFRAQQLDTVPSARMPAAVAA